MIVARYGVPGLVRRRDPVPGGNRRYSCVVMCSASSGWLLWSNVNEARSSYRRGCIMEPGEAPWRFYSEPECH
jgi:hypothetical protein